MRQWVRDNLAAAFLVLTFGISRLGWVIFIILCTD